MKYIIENQQWLIIIHAKCTFSPDFRALLFHSPTQVQTDVLFLKILLVHFIDSNNTSSKILENEGLYDTGSQCFIHIEPGLSVVHPYCAKIISTEGEQEEAKPYPL